MFFHFIIEVSQHGQTNEIEENADDLKRDTAIDDNIAISKAENFKPCHTEIEAHISGLENPKENVANDTKNS